MVSRVFYITLFTFIFFLGCYYFEILFSFKIFNFNIGFTEDSFLFKIFDSVYKSYLNYLLDNYSPSYLFNGNNGNNGARVFLTRNQNASPQTLGVIYNSKDTLEEMVYNDTLKKSNISTVLHYLRPLVQLREYHHVQEVYATAYYDGTKEAVNTLDAIRSINNRKFIDDFRKEL